MKALSTMKSVTVLCGLIIFLSFSASFAGEGDVAYPTDKWISLFGDNCLLNGEPLPLGAVIDAYDPDGNHCGQWIVDATGAYGFMSVYHDDVFTPLIDEGAEENDEITLFVNGIASSLLGPENPIWTKNGDPHEVNLSITQNISFDVIDPAGQFTSAAQTLIYQFNITNTGNGTDLFNLTATSEHGWNTEIITGNPTAHVDSSESIDVQVRLSVPSGISASMIDSLFLEVKSGMDDEVIYTGKTITTVIVTAAEDDNSLLPSKFSLSQNYPNPFNPETVINYSLKTGGNVHLEIYNLLGQSTEVLIDKHQDVGDYSVVWNSNQSGQNYPSGVYFYRLTVNEQTLTRKMILMK
jgi:Secretion system C-terminal sorting domain